MVRRAVSTSPESTNHHLNSHHHLSQAQTPTSSTSSLSSASDGQPVSQQPSPSSQQHSPVSVSSATGGSGGGGGAGGNGGNGANVGANSAGGGGHGFDLLQYGRQLPAPLPGQPHVHLTPAPHGENGGHGGPTGGGIFIAAGPYTGEYYSEHSYYYPHPDYGSPPPGQHICPVHDYGKTAD
uniref:Uncharacterized protein n=1 Tax=Anopheles dirus TaxID=7168 RepID=A0A182NED1_9DIPT